MAKKDKDDEEMPVKAECVTKCTLKGELVKPGEVRSFKDEKDVPRHFTIVKSAKDKADAKDKGDDDKK